MCKVRHKKKKKMTNDEYKQLVIKLHGSKYDLSKVEYNGMKEYVTPVCPIHGEFKIVAYDLAHIRGCGKCGIEQRVKGRKSDKTAKKSVNKLTTEEFIIRAKKVFGDYYNYEKTDLDKRDERGRVCITCPKHGDFYQNIYSHLHGHGCCKCGKESMSNTQAMTTESFIEKANKVHNGKYDYSETVYSGCYENVDIICPIHGKFTQVAYSHLNGHGCKKCANEHNNQLFLSNTEEFIEKAKKIHGNEYDYSIVDYQGAKVPVTIICKNGHVYSQMPNKHLSGHGCPYCTHNVSNQEKEIREYIESLGFKTKTSDRKTLTDTKELDLIIPSKKIAIEFDGLYWHCENMKPDKKYHLNKTLECDKKGLRLIHIFEDEWIYKKEIVKSRLCSILGVNKNRIHARKCEIREVDNKTCEKFLNENHIQGNVNSAVRYALYYNDEIVSIMTFGKLRKNMGQRKNIENRYELLRFCNKLYTTVKGGASKLFTHFIRKHNPYIVLSYADRRWNTGKVYEIMGFEFSHFSEPGYFYIVGQQRVNRFRYRKNVLVKEGYDKNKSEHEIMKERGIYRIYDCGTMVYKWKKNTGE